MKTFLIIVVVAVLAGGGVYYWQEQGELPEIVQYYCEQSGGAFVDDTCECPFEADLGQTSKSQYQKTDGTCQTTQGGPGGELGEQMNLAIGNKMQLDSCLKKVEGCE
jgi:hypothetical protein